MTRFPFLTRALLFLRYSKKGGHAKLRAKLRHRLWCFKIFSVSAVADLLSSPGSDPAAAVRCGLIGLLSLTRKVTKRPWLSWQGHGCDGLSLRPFSECLGFEARLSAPPSTLASKRRRDRRAGEPWKTYTAVVAVASAPQHSTFQSRSKTYVGTTTTPTRHDGKALLLLLPWAPHVLY